ncbi:MAG: hypothetical protein EXR62_04085 [Chloroflexi bacterium]|nr:hypothetical protein [Chloroflexota bacterium]
MTRLKVWLVCLGVLLLVMGIWHFGTVRAAPPLPQVAPAPLTMEALPPKISRELLKQPREIGVARPGSPARLTGWSTWLNDSFEGDFPGSWQIFDTTNNIYLWGQRDCRAAIGQYGLWAMGGGATGSLLTCGSDYPINTTSWLLSAPLDLRQVTDGEVRFKLWFDSKYQVDYLTWGVSIDDVFYVVAGGYSGSSRGIEGNDDGWVDTSFSLRHVGPLGNVTGQPRVTLIWRFDSRTHATPLEGVFLDDVNVQAYQPEPLATSTPGPTLRIAGIQATGEDEFAAIYNGGDQLANLAGWTLRAVGSGQPNFTFPPGYILAAGARERVHSGPAASISGSGLIWSNVFTWGDISGRGELRDSQGNLVHNYCYPAGCQDGVTPTATPTATPTNRPVHSQIYLPIVRRNFIPQRVPNDPFFASYQWNLRAINAPSAWAISTGSSANVVAILDTGMDMTHPDLAGRTVDSYDFVNNDENPADDNGHGTHIAGVVGAITNNGTGVAGLDWATRLMPVKVLDDKNSGSVSKVAAAITWAVDHGARVINLSLGTLASSQTLEQAVEYAWNHGAIVVAAAGNSYQNGNPIIYPAAYQHVVAVGATGVNDEITPYSEQRDYLDVVAPGGVALSSTDADDSHWITSTYFRLADVFFPTLGYNRLSGTSQATPHVAALASLIWAVNPDLTNAQVVRVIQVAAHDLGATGWDTTFGYGRIDVEAALRLAPGGAALNLPATARRKYSAVALNQTRVSQLAQGQIGAEMLIGLQRGAERLSVQRASQLRLALDLAGFEILGEIPQLHILRVRKTTAGAALHLPELAFIEPDSPVTGLPVSIASIRNNTSALLP